MRRSLKPLDAISNKSWNALGVSRRAQGALVIVWEQLEFSDCTSHRYVMQIMCVCTSHWCVMQHDSAFQLNVLKTVGGIILISLSDLSGPSRTSNNLRKTKVLETKTFRTPPQF